MAAIEAIQCLRKTLSIERSSTRIVGLSGVGKTRLVQVLFDDEVGENALNKDVVMYTDIADDPDPDPKHLMSQLIAQDYEGIMIVDNSSRELHANLTKICQRNESKLALLTIEYDVREQLPPETKVFRMEPTGDHLIEQMLLKQFLSLGELNAKKIAECAGGNYRLAQSIAETVNEEETLSTLSYELIFDRIFTQGNDKQDDLLKAAEGLSVLYSFDSSDSHLPDSELSLLGSFIEKTGLEMYRFAVEIENRQLIQKRGQWRAILPHAIANHLTKNFLTKFPSQYVWEKILESGSTRVIKSFSRRLGYLHNSGSAVEIADSIFKTDGWIGENLGDLDELGLQVLKNISPVSPEKVLEMFERVSKTTEEKGESLADNIHARDFAKILFHLSYEERLFLRATRLLFQFAKGRDDANNMNSPLAKITNLFKYALSGTHATAKTRCQFLEEYLQPTSDKEARSLAIRLLSIGLDIGRLMGMSDYSFGSHVRDYGYMPRTFEERREWIVSFLGLAKATVERGLGRVDKSIIDPSR